VYFVTQNPLDIPDAVLGQLGNRIQHALRAFTPRDQKAVRASAQTMRPNEGLDIEAAITELAVGEALVSLLDAKGRPCPTERAYVRPPGSQLGPITPTQRQALLQHSLVAGVYEKLLDRESAYELLRQHAQAAATGAVVGAANPAAPSAGGPGAAVRPGVATAGVGGFLQEALLGRAGPRGGQTPGLLQTVAQTALRAAASSVGRQLVRGVLGGLLGGGRRR